MKPTLFQRRVGHLLIALAISTPSAGLQAESVEFLRGFADDNGRLAQALAAPERLSEGEACAVKAILTFSGRRLDHAAGEVADSSQATAARLQALSRDLIRLRVEIARAPTLQAVLARCPVSFDGSD